MNWPLSWGRGFPDGMLIDYNDECEDIFNAGYHNIMNDKLEGTE